MNRTKFQSKFSLLFAVAVKDFVSAVHHHDDVYVAGELHGNKRKPITLLRVSNRDKSVPLEIFWDKKHAKSKQRSPLRLEIFHVFF